MRPLLKYLLFSLALIVGWQFVGTFREVLNVPASPNACAVPLDLIETAKRFHGALVVFCKDGRWVFPRNGHLVPLLETYFSLTGGKERWIRIGSPEKKKRS